MSVERVARKDGVVWRVRWRDELGRNRSRVLGRKADAEAFDAEVRRMKRTRELGMLDGGQRTLTDLGELWWRLHGETLKRGTQETYAAAWDTHVKDRLGPMKLRDLDAQTILAFRVDLEKAGVGPAAVRKSMALLHGVLQRGVEWGWIANNPAASIRKPAPVRQRAVTPLTPADIEALRTHHLMHDRRRDATLISVLAYAGLRPGEALALTWRHVGNRSLLVDGAVAYGEIGATKTGSTRSVPLLGPLADDLHVWWEVSGKPGDSELVFPGRDGRPWSKEAYKSWTRRSYAQPAKYLKIASTRPYDLRHSFVSLLIHEGRSVVDVAQQAGHAPTMTLSTYAHVFAELGHEDRTPAEEQIRRARDGRMYPFRTSKTLSPVAKLAKALTPQQALHRTRTGDPFLTMEVLYQLS